MCIQHLCSLCFQTMALYCFFKSNKPFKAKLLFCVLYGKVYLLSLNHNTVLRRLNICLIFAQPKNTRLDWINEWEVSIFNINLLFSAFSACLSLFSYVISQCRQKATDSFWLFAQTSDYPDFSINP